MIDQFCLRFELFNKIMWIKVLLMKNIVKTLLRLTIELMDDINKEIY